ncbi:transcriptional regulator BolA [Moraxella macacae 0408225]|uniref:Transcriptional regulator BolA n=1 Tax=Moraxella macacae 0408225 TaxID=1230338 RepID=L2F7V4_9GAMM|nr:BolA family protein [Moraxella macacae]ELA09134.1 transcriptional regulator BolA [Moraxella macacae 0408225]
MSTTPIADALTQSIQVLNPTFVELKNESMNHANYFAGKESHFKLIIVSDAFANQRLVKRHQLVYDAVNNLLSQGGGKIHALAIHAYTPIEWQETAQAPKSPACAGHNKGGA